jgi:DNA polymerase I-like protein with 3'-5' exonuclease and polymerase domains
LIEEANVDFFDLLGLTRDSFFDRRRAGTEVRNASNGCIVHDPEDIELCGRCPGGKYVYFSGEALRIFLLRVLDHKGPLALDIETGGLHPQTSSIFLVSISDTPGCAGVFDFRQVPMDLFQCVLREKSFIIHNACFELPFLAYYTGVMPKCSFDTMVARQLVTAGDRTKGASLAECLKDYFDIKMDKDVRSVFPKLAPDSPLTTEEVVYSAGDVTLLIPLAEVLRSELERLELSSVYWELEHPLLPIIAEHYLEGVKVDLEHLKNLEIKYSESIRTCEAEIAKLAPGLVWTSNPALLKYLKEKYKIELDNVDREALDGVYRKIVSERGKIIIEGVGQVPEDEEDARKLAQLEEKYPVLKLIRLILDARYYGKMLSTYIRPLLNEGPHQLAGIVEPKVKGGVLNPVTGRVHPSFRTLGTETGRFSCTEPNLQNIPQEQEFRSIFICEDDEVVITSDYSQFEVRYLAEVSGEENMINMFLRIPS